MGQDKKKILIFKGGFSNLMFKTSYFSCKVNVVLDNNLSNIYNRYDTKKKQGICAKRHQSAPCVITVEPAVIALVVIRDRLISTPDKGN